LYHYTISHTISLFRIQGKLEVPQLSREELGGKGLGGCNWPDLNHRIDRKVRRDCPSLALILSWCDSVCLVKFPVGDEPFDILRVNGSGDLVVNYHSVGISPYSESDSIRDIVYYFKFLDSPKLDLLVEADRLGGDECQIDTGGAVALSKRDDFEATDLS